MPHPLTDKVDRLAARLRRRGWLTGWSLLTTVVLGVAALLIGVDYLTRWSDVGVRWLVTGAWIAAAAWAADRFLLRPRGGAERPRFDQVAHRIEQQFPTLGSRLTSSLEFLGQSEDDPAAGSAELRRAVISKTAAEVERVDFADTIDRAPLRRAASRLGWLAAGVALVTLLEPASVATGVTRLAAPWAGADWPRRNHLAFNEAPTRIARGQSFEATLVDKNGAPPADAQIVYRFETSDGRRTERRALQPSGGQLLAVLENVQQTFAYRAIGGDDHTMPWSRVEVVDPPQLKSLTITATPPDYTGLPSGPAGPRLRVIDGTRLDIAGVANEPLAEVTLELNGESVLQAPISQDEQGTPNLISGEWTAKLQAEKRQDATYRFRLVTRDGLVGLTEALPIVIEPDGAPTVDWVSPGGDLFVTKRAVVPLVVAAEDDLAVRRVDVQIVTEYELGDIDMPVSIPPLFAGQEAPPRREADAPPDSRELSFDWDLATLDLKEGVTLQLTPVAEDYSPRGPISGPQRRVTIISDEEFNQRIADAQSHLLRDLQRALNAERDARDKTREVADGAVDKGVKLDRLSTLAFDQRRVAELIADPQRGARRQAEQLLEELAQNRVDRPGLASQLRRIADEARRLGAKPLPEASRAIADARRSAETDAADARLAESLAAADREQTEVVDTLERLTDEMAEWSDLDQFARELADLQEKQQALRDATAIDAAKSAAITRTPAARATDRQRLADGQAELGRRFDKLMRAMQRRLDAAGDNADGADSPSDEALAPVADTVAEADERATTGKLRDATRQIREGRLGRAGEAQEQAAQDLEELLETLRNRASSDPSQLAEQLRKAQQRLAELQERVDQLEREAADPRQQAAKEQRVAEQAERLSRQLDRLTADEAADSTEGGADQLADAAEQSQSGRQQEGARQSRQDAREQLRQAEQQLAERIRQLENEAAQRLLAQLAADVEAYLQRQRLLLEQTVELSDNEPLGPVAPVPQPDKRFAEQSRSLAGDQRGLEAKVGESAEKLAERKVFSLALGGAAEEMKSAAERLNAVDPGRATQQHELSAIERLKHIADALASTPPEDEEQPPSEGQGGGGQQGQPPEPPPFDVAELKMLRLMQLDLNARTRRFESESGGRFASEEARSAAKSLAAEQRELADLVQELLNRNNKDPRLAPPPEIF